MSKNISELKTKMRPGNLSMQGFLGIDEDLETILTEDKNTLKKLGVTYLQIADKIERILLTALSLQQADPKSWMQKRTPFPNLYEPQSIPHFSRNELPDLNKGYLIGKFHVFLMQWRGVQECPWGCNVDPTWTSIDFMILNRESGDSFTGPGLIVHLIREHNFFEGKQTPYRVDPQKVMQVLEIS